MLINLYITYPEQVLGFKKCREQLSFQLKWKTFNDLGIVFNLIKAGGPNL